MLVDTDGNSHRHLAVACFTQQLFQHTFLVLLRLIQGFITSMFTYGVLRYTLKLSCVFRLVRDVLPSVVLCNPGQERLGSIVLREQTAGGSTLGTTAPPFYSLGQFRSFEESGSKSMKRARVFSVPLSCNSLSATTE